jgi:hypothetical protein
MGPALNCEQLLLKLDYKMDKRNPPENKRKGQFRVGWRRGKISEGRLKEQLTWHNLGFRLGKLLGPKSDSEIDEIYEQFAAHYNNALPPKTSNVPLINKVLNSLSREYILLAFNDFEAKVPHKFADSTDYDVLHEGRRYPPKAIIGLAARHLTGSPLTPSDFTGGEGSTCFRVLRSRGFEIAPKGEVSPFPDDVDSEHQHVEGASQQVLVNRYERSREAREKCINHYGAMCQVCRLDFSERYGEIGKGFIHVHHLRQLSEIGSEYVVDPIKDLRPVCPNCHAMIHRRKPPFTLEELRRLFIQHQDSA